MFVVGGRLLRACPRAIAALPLRDAAMTITGDGRASQQNATLHFSVPETVRPVFLMLEKDVADSASNLNRTAVQPARG